MQLVDLSTPMVKIDLGSFQNAGGRMFKRILIEENKIFGNTAESRWIYRACSRTLGRYRSLIIFRMFSSGTTTKFFSTLFEVTQ